MTTKHWTTMKELEERIPDSANEHDPTWDEGNILSINTDEIPTDDTDYPFKIEWWKDDSISDEQRVKRLTQDRARRQTERQAEAGAMKVTTGVAKFVLNEQPNTEQFKINSNSSEILDNGTKDMR